MDQKQWYNLIEQSSVSSFFQTQGCYDFYVSLSFLRPFLFGVSENNHLKGVICGYIIADGGKITQYFSRRAIIPGGVLLADDISENALQELLLTTINQLQKKTIYIEMRNYNNYTKFKSVFESAGFSYKEHLNYQIPLSSEEIVFQNFSQSKQRQIKQAQKSGVYWEETKNEDDIKSFYAILSRLYQTKIKRPLFPIEFFRKLVILSHGKILVVKKSNEVIGGMACITFDNKVLYEWFVCGSEAVDKKYYSSIMATWAGIEYAIQNKIQYFDFMGAGKPNEEYGVREFKSKFGGQLVQYGRFKYICNPFLYALGSVVIKSS